MLAHHFTSPALKNDGNGAHDMILSTRILGKVEPSWMDGHRQLIHINIGSFYIPTMYH